MEKIISNKDSVEAIIKKAKPDYLKNLHRFRIQVQKEHSDQLEKEKKIQKIDFAIKRVNAPLEKWNKLKSILIPFGILSILPKTGKLEYEQFEKYGFIKREKEWYIYSTIGLIIYITIGIIAARIF